MPFLPVSKEDMEQRGLKQLDFVYVCGDAYVDHPSFGHAIISRVLEAHGYSVGIIAQPDWKDDDSVAVFGEPRLGFLISGGNMDSMVNHYTVNKKKRSEDAYSPGGKTGYRPDRAVIVYGNLIKRKFKNVPVIIGGIEASLRRMGHYDYWSDSMKRSVLLDSGADILSYGMGEKSIVEIADALNAGIKVSDITYVRGTVYKARTTEQVSDGIVLPEYEEIRNNKRKYAESFAVQYENTDPFTAHTLIEEYDHNVYIIQNPPAYPLTTQEMDDIYALPYMNDVHPKYREENLKDLSSQKQGNSKAGVPAINEIRFSITNNRGCFGGCSFCSLTFHQGRIVQARSHESILKEAEAMTKDPEFKGYIHDVGGPTADFRFPSCSKQLKQGVCKGKQCLYPKPCRNLKIDHSDYVSLLRKLRKIDGVKKVFIRSGIRFDYLMADKDDTFFHEMLKYHVSGQLRVAPEHISDTVLNYMGKPGHEVYEGFLKKYETYNKKTGRKQYAVPYLMSSHPGSTMKEAVELAEYIRDLGYMPQQVQDFYPTPSTLSTVMYYTGIDPRDMKKVFVERNPHRKAMQRALIQYRDPKNYELVKEALLECDRTDLIGYGKECLIPPRPWKEKSKDMEKSGNRGMDKNNSKDRSRQGRSKSRHSLVRNRK
ncbi:MAG: YgiQ family radical SAM protein [Lachnospiraceae bacterium]|nr:YgiQ family radical SAM protein [Lachnospiraceae bacterium]